MILEKELMKFKLEVDGYTYYFSEVLHLQEALKGSYTRYLQMCSYCIYKGTFVKNRSVGTELPNAMIHIGRDAINKMFDALEGK